MFVRIADLAVHEAECNCVSVPFCYQSIVDSPTCKLLINLIESLIRE
jgi:hypothetical protein